MTRSKIKTASITDDAVTTAKVNPAQTDITSVGTLTSFRSTGIDDNADALAMTIDASENVLVGGTEINPQNQSSGSGSALRADGRGLFRGTNTNALAGNRIGNDGEVVRISKNGTMLGALYTFSNEIALVSGNTGLYFDDPNNRIQPLNASGGVRDNTIDLGASNSRFKNLYLSGGVYLGGTGSANYLDDYEEGSFDVTLRRGGNSGGDSTRSCRYKKIGSVVILNFVNDGTVSPYYSPVPSGSSYAADQSVEIVSQLPFTPTMGNAAVRLGHSRTLKNTADLAIGCPHNSTTIYLGRAGINNLYYPSNNALTENAQTNISIIATFIYQSE